MLGVWLKQMPEGAGGSLKRIVASGEALSGELARQCRQLLPEAGLYNLYGPTEAAIDVSWWECTGSEEAGVPIGRPISNVRLYVVDEQQRPVPVGVAGELCIAGVCLARGYAGRPDLTAERFVADGVSGEAGERLYRTGDVARWRPDGVLEYLGRRDGQVKLRGQRIEVGEIEAALQEHVGVAEAAVAVEGRGGEARLVAYLVATGAVRPGVEELRERLSGTLPGWMLPAEWVWLDEMPRTGSGKLDRKRLAAMDGDRVRVAQQARTPQTPVQELIAAIWSQVLGVDEVGAEDNFFALGGHSLVAVQVAHRIGEAFGIELPLRVIFEAPTVSAMAVEVQRLRAEGHAALPPVRPSARDAALPLSFAQQRLWFLDQLQPGNVAYNLTEAVRLEGELDYAALQQAWQQLAERHEPLRTRFENHDGTPVQIMEAAGPVTIEFDDLSGTDAAQQQQQMRQRWLEQAGRAFDLSRTPLYRILLLKLGEHDHTMVLTMHHIIGDGWSMGVLVRDFAALYEAARKSVDSPLPPLAVQAADVAVWERESLTGPVLEPQLRYWREHLAGPLPVLELARPGHSGNTQPGRGEHHHFRLDEKLAQQLRAVCQREGATLFMGLLAAFQTLLARWSGQHDIIVGTDVANRRRRETEDLIGFFVNMLALRADLSGNPRFRDLLAQVRRICLDAYMHQDVPFDRLVDELQPDRSLSHSPLFNTVFVFDEAPKAPPELTSLRLSSVAGGPETARFPLSLAVTQDGPVLAGVWRYDTGVFDAATVRCMAEEFETFLGRVAAAPDSRVMAVDLVSDEEQQRRRAAIAGLQKSGRQRLRAIAGRGLQSQSTGGSSR
jgi:acyl carrier protein